MDTKKAREAAQVAEVAQLYPDFPPGQIAPSEAPDFLVGVGFAAVGLEVTDFVRGQSDTGSPQRQAEAQHREVCRRAGVLFRQTNTEPLFVNVHWRSEEKLTGARMTVLARSLAALVRTEVPVDLFGNTRHDWETIHETPLDGLVHTITVTRMRNDGQAAWATPEAGWIAFDPADVQAAITPKEHRIAQYRAQCSEAWLLIVAEGTRVSSSMDFDDRAITAYPFVSSFDRVLLFGRVEKRVLRLTTTR